MRFINVITAYILSSIASGITLANLVLLTQIISPGSYVDPFPRPDRDTLGWFFLSFLFFPLVVAKFCAVPSLVAALVGELGRIRTRTYHLLTAILVCAVVDLALVAYHGASDVMMFGLKGVFCGVVQGCVYWRIAGRRAGEWG